ncbi:MAG: hypothetical protein Q9198_004163 [Flavoplaca austrocitrina]
MPQFKYVPLEALQAAAIARKQATNPQLDFAPTQVGAKAPSMAIELAHDKNLQQAHKRPFKQVATASSESSLEHTIKRSRNNGSAGTGSANSTGLHFTSSATTSPHPLASNYSNDDEEEVEVRASIEKCPQHFPGCTEHIVYMFPFATNRNRFESTALS